MLYSLSFVVLVKKSLTIFSIIRLSFFVGVDGNIYNHLTRMLSV